MNIAWQYLDKRAATISALRDYKIMKQLLDHVQEEIHNMEESMTTVNSPAVSDMPRGPRNPRAGETRMAGAIDAICVLTERHSNAREYMDWFHPGWKALTEDERCILRYFYMDDGHSQTDRVAEVCELFHIERTSAYKKKDRALAHLALLLYGR